MTRIIPYRVEHWDIFEPRPIDLEYYGELNTFKKCPLSDNGINFTAVHNGRILIMGGILPLSEGTGYAWNFLSRYCEGKGVFLYRLVRKEIETLMKNNGIHRVETVNLVHARDHNKWCKALGFVEEGLMCQYDDQKRDYYRLAKIMGV